MTADPRSHRFFPLGIDLRDRPCVVVGGGTIGTRKALTLARAGATVRVVSPRVTEALRQAATSSSLTWVREAFHPEHVDGAFLVVVATDDPAVNLSAADAAVRVGALLCDATSARRSQVIFGAKLTRDDATVTVFTDGRDPGHARRTRNRIAALLSREGSGPLRRGPGPTSGTGREPC